MVNIPYSDYAWIVKPVLKVTTTEAIQHLPLPGVSPKHGHDGHIVAGSNTEVKSQMKVLEMKDIEKEFLLVSARLKLASRISSKKK